MPPRPPARPSPWTFFGLVFILAVPFWLIGPVVQQRLIPNDTPINLPLSALQFVCPTLAAAILVSRQQGAAGVKRLVARPFDWRRIRPALWYAPIFLLIPLLLAVEYGVLRAMGRAVPLPAFPVWLVPVFFAAFFLPAACEEIGWSGYALEPLQARWSALGAGLLIGLVWAAFHVVPNTQVPHPPMWHIGQFGNTVALRVLLVWIYNNTRGSVFAATALHDMTNVGEFLFPIYGSYFDAFVFFVIAGITAVIVAVVWGPRTLTRSQRRPTVVAGTAPG
jgi:uncharacterized protein